MQAKKLIILFLLIVACTSSIRAMNDQSIKLKPQPIRKELVKVFAGLVGTGIFGYLSYKTTTNDSNTPPSDLIEKADMWILNNISNKLLDLKNNRIHQYIGYGCLPIITGIAAYECAKYTIAKIKNIIKQKKLTYQDNNK